MASQRLVPWAPTGVQLCASPRYSTTKHCSGLRAGFQAGLDEYGLKFKKKHFWLHVQLQTRSLRVAEGVRMSCGGGGFLKTLSVEPVPASCGSQTSFKIHNQRFLPSLWGVWVASASTCFPRCLLSVVFTSPSPFCPSTKPQTKQPLQHVHRDGFPLQLAETQVHPLPYMLQARLAPLSWCPSTHGFLPVGVLVPGSLQRQASAQAPGSSFVQGWCGSCGARGSCQQCLAAHSCDHIHYVPETSRPWALGRGMPWWPDQLQAFTALG